MGSRNTLNVAAGTDPGRSRKINQDNVLAFVRPRKMGDALGLLIVADGMGGHQAGEIASQLAVDTIREELSWMLEQDDMDSTIPITPPDQMNNDDEGGAAHLEKRLQIAVQEANKIIFDYAQKNPVDAGNLGCTVTCAIVYGDVAVVANVGDSRTYYMHEGELQQITRDHSYVAQMVNEGHLKYEDIFDHPQRNVITRALGNQPEVAVDVLTQPLDTGDRLLLCSDGVWEMIRDHQEMRHLLADSQPLETIVQNFIDTANAYGGADNIGVVVAELQ